MLSDMRNLPPVPRLSIHALAERLAIQPHQLSPQGHHKGKLSLELLKSQPDGQVSWCW